MQQLEGSDEEPREYARGGLILGPGGSDSVPSFPFEREAIIDRHGRVICRWIGRRWIRPDEEGAAPWPGQ